MEIGAVYMQTEQQLQMEVRSISNIIIEKFQYEKSALDFFKERSNDALDLYNALFSDFVSYSRNSANLLTLKDMEISSLNKQLTYTTQMSNQHIQMLENYLSDTKQMCQKQVELLEINQKEVTKTLERELLRTHGLLTSRGVFEHSLTLVAKEQNIQPFNASKVCNKLSSLTRHGFKWTDAMISAIEKGAPGKNVSEYARNLYSLLSNEIHGYPWRGQAVDIKFDKTNADEAEHFEVISSLCKNLGLI
jgi:hypothetical protein